jgi:hypothetical protein
MKQPSVRVLTLAVLLSGTPYVRAQDQSSIPPDDASETDASTAAETTHGDIVIFPGPLDPLLPPGWKGKHAPANTKLGMNIPNGHYSPGSGWWALTCDTAQGLPDNKRKCRISKTNLSVTPGQKEIPDGEPIPSQWLHWSPLPAQLDVVGPDNNKPQELEIVFKVKGALSNVIFKEGPFVTYLYDAQDNYPGTGNQGTTEVRVPTGDGNYMDFVPRILRSSINDANRAIFHENDSRAFGVDVLELRSHGLRQRLPAGWPMYSRDKLIRNPREYLWWAGDLDGDGKLDFILCKDGFDGFYSVVLYLSSLAKPGELVGEAGSVHISDSPTDAP